MGLRALYSPDPPYNCFTSLHVAHSFVSALTSYRVHRSLAASGVRSSSAARHENAYSWYPSPSLANSPASSVLAGRTPRNFATMKKTASKGPKPSKVRVTAPALKRRTPADELRPHYDVDYRTAKPNRFASRFGEGAVAVVLEPDTTTVVSP